MLSKIRWAVACCTVITSLTTSKVEASPNPTITVIAETNVGLSPEPIGTLDRASLIADVLARNPSLAAAKEAFNAARERGPQMSALEDPMVDYNIAPGTAFNGMRLGQSVELSQAIPFPGKRRLRGAIADAEAEVALGDWNEARLELAFMTSTLFYEYEIAHRALVIAREHLALVEAMKRNAESQYISGRATQSDVLRAEVEIGDLLHAIVEAESEVDTARAQINGLLHRAPNHPLAPPAAQENAAVEQSLPDEEALVQEAIGRRPELKSLRSELTGQDAAVELAKRERWPDFRVMAGYNSMWMETAERFMVGVSVNIPLQLSRRSHAIDEAEARSRAVQREQEAFISNIRVEIHQALTKLKEATHLEHLFRTRLLPAAQDQVAVTRAGFESGRNPFDAVIDSERTLRSIKLRYERARADVHRRKAQLNRAIGGFPGLTSESLKIEGGRP